MKTNSRKAVEVLINNSADMAQSIGMKTSVLIKSILSNDADLINLINDYQTDYNMMLNDFGSKDITVISYKYTIDYLENIYNNRVKNI